MNLGNITFVWDHYGNLYSTVFTSVKLCIGPPHIHSDIRFYIYIYVCVCVYIYLCRYVYMYIYIYEGHTALRNGRSRVRFPMVSLEFFIEAILPAALWPRGRISL